jgi:Fic family protein
MNNINDKLECIRKLKNELDEKRPLNADFKKNLKIYYDTAIINNSIRGKGNSFTLQEIKGFLFDGSTIIGKTDNEQLEIKNYKKALDYIEELAEKKIDEWNEPEILNIHLILFNNIAPETAGKYRNCPTWITLENGEKETVCEHSLIPKNMNNYFNWLLTDNNETPLITAAEAHNKLVEIHPFCDGNGRTARLTMNLILMSKGYAPIIIKNYIKSKFNLSIKTWRKGEKDDFYNIIADCEIESLKQYLGIIPL